MARDPRRSPGFFLLHVVLIILLIATGCVLLATRLLDEAKPGRAAGASLLGGLRGPSAAEGEPGLGPLSTPPAPPVSLDGRLAALGYEMPEGANLYAVRVVEGEAGRTYEQFQAGGGALGVDFWPASSIKVLAALGALDFARSLGYSGAATVTIDGVSPYSLREIYEPAIRDSSNYDHDLLVQIAGLDRLNAVFLTAANGFPVTTISRSYSGVEFKESPAMTFEEGDRWTSVPARVAELDPECDAGNCSNLFEMTESVRRIVLNDQLPREQRFDLDPSDLAALSEALLDAEGFFDDAVAATLGSGARTWSKPGDAAELDCLDVAFIESEAGKRFLLAAVVPHRSGGCEALGAVAEGALRLLG